MSTPKTPIVSENAEFSWFGLARYGSTGGGRSLPRFAPPTAELAVKIPDKTEKARALAILSAFSEAEELFWLHNSEKIEREIERTQSKVTIHQLGKKLDLCDPEIFGQASGRMSELRFEAAALAASLLDKLAKVLHDDLRETALGLEKELSEAGIPLSEDHYREPTTFALHGYHEFNDGQLRYELVRHCAERLRDAKHVSSGCAGEFSVLKWFAGESTESPLSV